MCPNANRLSLRSLLVGGALATLLLVGCGGGGSEGSDAAPVAATAVAPVAPTASRAYAKTLKTTHYTGKGYGWGRAVAMSLLDLCNSVRSRDPYRLPPVVPTEALLASFDQIIVEKYFTTDKALTQSSGVAADIPDYFRWGNESNAGTVPAVPPNCLLQQVPFHNATLWRDGMVYELTFDDKRAQSRVDVPPPLDQAAQLFDKAPEVHVLGQTCRDIIDPPGLVPGSHSCVWDLFPYAAKLNWPFVLSGRLEVALLGMTETIEALEARADEWIDSAMFELPAGFRVTGP